MGHPQSQWKTKKFKNRRYVGNYTEDRSGKRVFVLTAVLRTGKKVRETYESFEKAKNDSKFKWKNVSPHRRIKKKLRRKK